MCWCKVNDGSHSRIREGGGTAREEVGTEDPEALYTKSAGWSAIQSPTCPLLLPSRPGHFNQISPS